jgi:hypothetical protein
MGSGPMKLGDDAGDGFTDARDLGEAVFLDQHVERDRKCGEAVRSARVGLGTVRIAAAQCRPLRILSQQPCYGLGIGGRHSTVSRRITPPSSRGGRP